MRTKTTVNCTACNKEFLKPLHHVKENLKLGHRFFCSLSCQIKLKSKKVLLTCDNSTCYNSFQREPSAVSKRNFCSHKCAALIINPETGQKLKKLRYCQHCQIQIHRKQKYCSLKCWAEVHKTSTKVLVKELQNLAKKLGRTPTRRESRNHGSCKKYFGSWNNAVIAAGLVPHRSKSQRMYKRIETYAKDGHYCFSISELLIDNWLTDQGIQHKKEVPYPEYNFSADWSLADKKVFVEYFGLANDLERYDQTINKKKAICHKYGIKLIDLYARDLFPVMNLDTKISKHILGF